MRYLLRKNLRDFFQLKADFFSTFLLALLGLLVFSGLTSAWKGMEVEYNAYSKKTHLADLWVNAIDISNLKWNKIKSLSGIDKTQLNKNVVVNSYFDSSNKELLVIVPSANNLSIPYSIKGENFEVDKEGLWISNQFANENRLKINDTLTITYNDAQIDAIIKGIIMSPNFISYNGSGNELISNNKDYGYAYASSDYLNRLNPNYNNQLLVSAKSKTELPQIKNEIKEILGNDYLNSMTEDNYSGIVSYTNKAQTLKKLSVVFSIVFLLLAILTILTTMKRLVTNQQILIGTMKAIGIRNSSVFFHYSLYGFIVTFLGGSFGILFSPLIANFVLNLQKESYAMPVWKATNSILIYIVFLFIVSIGTLTSLLASKNVIRGLPAMIMRPNSTIKSKKSVFELVPNFWNNLSFEWKWVLRDISRSKNKSIISIIGIVGSLLLMIASFGLQDSLAKGNKTTYGTQYTYKNKGTLKSNLTEKQLDVLTAEFDNQGQLVEEIPIELNSSSSSSDAVLNVVAPGLYLNLLDRKNHFMNINVNGVVLTKRMADELNVERNSYIDIRIIGKKDLIPVQVKEISYTSSPQGVFLSKDTWEKIGQNFQPTSFFVGDKVSGQQLAESPYIDYTTSLKRQKDDAKEVMKSVTLVVIVLSVFAIAFTAIVLYNLGTLNLTERYREYATMKVLGFRKKEINSIILNDSLFNLSVGWIISIPSGIVFLRVFVSLGSSNSFEIFPFISLMSIIIITLIILSGTLVISLIISKKVNKINMIDALKSVE